MVKRIVPTDKERARADAWFKVSAICCLLSVVGYLNTPFPFSFLWFLTTFLFLYLTLTVEYWVSVGQL